MWTLKIYLWIVYIVILCCLITNSLKHGGCISSHTCKLIKDCPQAIESMRKTTTHKLEVCGYFEGNQLVCCPPPDARAGDTIIILPNIPTDSSNVIPKAPEGNVNYVSEGSECRSSGRSEICKRVEDCHTDSTKLTKCGIIGGNELVCCPAKTISNSKEFCKKLSNDFGSSPTLFISGGNEVDSGDYGHMAALGYLNGSETEPVWKCGASIISTKFLLTAAHCIRNKDNLKPTVVRLGVTKLDEKPFVNVAINRTIIHYEYNRIKMHNDIALIELEQNLSFNDKIYPACLHHEDVVPSTLTVTGWGKTNGKNTKAMSNALREATVNRQPFDECYSYFKNRAIDKIDIIDSQICATYNTGDTCAGDSGGPIQTKDNNGIYSIVGITTFGTGINCDKNIYGVYTKVSKYIEWIDKIAFGH